MSRFIIFVILLIPACGKYCDTTVEGLCIVKGDLDVDIDALAFGISATQEMWSNEIENVNISDLTYES